MSERLHLLHYSLGRRRQQQKLSGSFICQVKDMQLCYCHSSLFTRRSETCASFCCIHTCSSERVRRRKQAVLNKIQTKSKRILINSRGSKALSGERSFAATDGAVLIEQNELGKMTEFQMFFVGALQVFFSFFFKIAFAIHAGRSSQSYSKRRS